VAVIFAIGVVTCWSPFSIACTEFGQEFYGRRTGSPAVSGAAKTPGTAGCTRWSTGKAAAVRARRSWLS
jgi:hypothetical protein